MKQYVPPRFYGLAWIGIAVGLGYHIAFHPTDVPTIIVTCIACACLTIAGILNVIYGTNETPDGRQLTLL